MKNNNIKTDVNTRVDATFDYLNSATIDLLEVYLQRGHNCSRTDACVPPPWLYQPDETEEGQRGPARCSVLCMDSSVCVSPALLFYQVWSQSLLGYIHCAVICMMYVVMK